MDMDGEGKKGEERNDLGKREEGMTRKERDDEGR